MSKKDINQILSEGLNLPESVQTEVLAAWEARIEEAKASLREEFAAKYEHDKQNIVEAMDAFVNSKLTTELEEFSRDKLALANERARLKEATQAQVKQFAKFVAESLEKEITEFRNERKLVESKLSVMEHFVAKKLYEEISEFEEDKKDLIAEKVRVVTEGQRQIVEAKNKFLKVAAKVVSEKTNKALKRELSVLKEDIQQAKQNDFGRRIFETFASEYMVSHLNESKELNTLKQQLSQVNEQMTALNESYSATKSELETAKKVLSESKKIADRQRILSEMVAPLAQSKRTVMLSLLENVATDRLNVMYQKYLPVVLKGETNVAKSKGVLSESRVESTGNRASQARPGDEAEQSDIIDLQRLAGLRNK